MSLECLECKRQAGAAWKELDHVERPQEGPDWSHCQADNPQSASWSTAMQTPGCVALPPVGSQRLPRSSHLHGSDHILQLDDCHCVPSYSFLLCQCTVCLLVCVQGAQLPTFAQLQASGIVGTDTYLVNLMERTQGHDKEQREKELIRATSYDFWKEVTF